MNTKKPSLLLFAALSIPSFMIGVDLFIMGVALEPMSKALSLHLGSLQWLLTGYAIGTACAFIPSGKLADTHGRKNIFMLGIAIFTIASLGISLSSSGFTIIILRIVQGAGGAMTISAALSLVMHLFPVEERALPMGMLVSASGLGMAIGPVLGGVLIHHFSWRFVFWINIPIGIINILLTQWRIQDTQTRNRQPIDFIGLFFLTTSLILLTTGLSQSKVWGWDYWGTWATILIALALWTLLMVVERYQTSPVFDYHLFHIQNYLTGSLCGIIVYFSLIGWLFVIGIYLQRDYGLNPMHAGIALLPFSITFFIGATTAGRIAKRVGFKRNMMTGFIASLLGLIAFSIVDPSRPYYVLIIGFVLFAIGFTFVNSASIPLALHFVPKNKAGHASGKTMMIRWLGGAIGSTILATVYATTSHNITTNQYNYTYGLHVCMWLLLGINLLGFLLATYTIQRIR